MKKIAERKFKLIDNPNLEVNVILFAPEEVDDVVSCTYEIHWPSKIQTGQSMGVDSLQALLLAIRHIGSDIYCSDYVESGNLFWLEKGRGFGLILPKSISERYEGDDPPI